MLSLIVADMPPACNSTSKSTDLLMNCKWIISEL